MEHVRALISTFGSPFTTQVQSKAAQEMLVKLGILCKDVTHQRSVRTNDEHLVWNSTAMYQLSLRLRSLLERLLASISLGLCVKDFD
ncbi:hypothetical protein C5167_029075 [Papaver somniferum]|nr:hypothetical protein C5167_029075 [Papaver somniferum]